MKKKQKKKLKQITLNCIKTNFKIVQKNIIPINVLYQSVYKYI